jgi:hypothetical protein
MRCRRVRSDRWLLARYKGLLRYTPTPRLARSLRGGRGERRLEVRGPDRYRLRRLEGFLPYTPTPIYPFHRAPRRATLGQKGRSRAIALVLLHSSHAPIAQVGPVFDNLAARESL